MTEPMEAQRITEILQKRETREGIDAYLEIMELARVVNVSEDAYFQRRYNHFYRVMKRSVEWYKIYFSSMEQWKSSSPTFDGVLDHLWQSLGRCEPSFSSKLVATLDPHKPVWDAFVLKYTHIKAPSYNSKNKLAKTKAAYQSIVRWYEQFLNSDDGKLVVSVFNESVTKHAKITDLKKIDFVLWQTRD